MKTRTGSRCAQATPLIVTPRPFTDAQIQQLVESDRAFDDVSHVDDCGVRHEPQVVDRRRVSKKQSAAP